MSDTMIDRVRALPVTVSVALSAVALACAGCSTVAAQDVADPMHFSPFMVAMSVNDMEAETAFYRDVLGFTVARDASMRDGAVQFRWLVNGTQRIELIKAAGSTAGTPHPAPPGHAAVRGFTQFTMQTSDIAAVRARIVERGVTPALEPTDVAALGIRVMYVTDPEGNAVEIAQVIGG